MSTCLSQQLKVRDERLGEASDLQKFLQNLDHFQQWLTRTQTTIASEDIPSDLAEAERMLNQHEQIKSEIDGYADEYASMKNYGEQVVEGQDDVQYMFLREVCVEGFTGGTLEYSRVIISDVCEEFAVDVDVRSDDLSSFKTVILGHFEGLIMCSC